MKKAVVLLSGGLDSATCLAMAREAGFEAHAISFAYGQRHAGELHAARAVATALGAVEHRIVTLDIGQFGGSALTDTDIAVPDHDSTSTGIPVTYVPARNTVFLAIALGFAESIGAHALFIGVNSVDYSGYPDCRPHFIEAFERLANLATKSGVEGTPFRIHAPLQHLDKAEIIREGTRLGVDYGLTVSCYRATPDNAACGCCDSCAFRRDGFARAGIFDPTRYQKG